MPYSAPPFAPAATAPLSVAQLCRLLQEVVESNFMQVTVEGECANLARPASGHCYFSLRDEKAQIRAVLFRRYQTPHSLPLEDGAQLVCRGHLSLYSPRGDVQLIATSVEAAGGTGSLRQQWLKLKARLEAEGLFARDSKRPLPRCPQRLGLITSTSGAALQDILRVLRQSSLPPEVILAPASVQGAAAPAELCQALDRLEAHGAADIILMGRGGGSQEDLWQFNDERVVRRIAACQVPVITAIGHEIDITLSDLAADAYALTPTAGAQRIVSLRQEMQQFLDELQRRLTFATEQNLNHRHQLLERLQQRLLPPQRYLQLQQTTLNHLAQRLQHSIHTQLQQHSRHLDHLQQRLVTLSPQNTLQRGYAIVYQHPHGILHQATEANPGSQLQVQLAQGSLQVRVESRDPEKTLDPNTNKQR